MNDQPRTIGESIELAFARLAAELTAARDVLAQECAGMPQTYNPLDAFTEHLIEGMDALIEASGVAGRFRKEVVLRAALERHGFSLANENAPR